MKDIELYNEIGKNIKKARQKMGITQLQLADLTHYSDSFIANIESKTYQSFSISALNNIAKCLNTTILELLPNEKMLITDSNTVKCSKCKYEIELPIELKLIIDDIKYMAKDITLTCPICQNTIKS